MRPLKYLYWIIGFIAIVAAVDFAVFNQAMIDIDPLWPLPFPFKAPAYVLALGGLGVGILVGALILWLSTAKARLVARRSRRIIERLQKDLDDLRQSQRPADRPDTATLSIGHPLPPP